jgi:hypothetical protein
VAEIKTIHPRIDLQADKKVCTKSKAGKTTFRARHLEECDSLD